MATPDVFARKAALFLRTFQAGARIVTTSSGFMVRLYVKFVGLALIAALPVAAQNAPKPTASNSKPGIHRVHKRKVSKPAKPPAPSVPEPIPAMTPEQLPATPPQVSYLNGQLTVQSENATLADVLNAIRKQTGASIDMPPGSANERVAAHLGPAPARDVITQLLAGSRFDYIILGSNQYPGGVDRVVLTVRQGGPASSPATSSAANIPPQAYAPRPGNQVPPADYNPNPDADDESAPDTAVGSTPEEEQPPQPQPNQQSAPADQSDQQQQQNPGVKTPEQLLQELQRMQQRDRGPANPPITRPPGGQSDQSQGAQSGADQANPPQ